MNFRILALLSIVAAIASTECMAGTADYNVVVKLCAPAGIWSRIIFVDDIAVK